MCSGPRNPSPQNPSLLLELSASNDISSFKRLVEDENQDVNGVALWYCRRSIGSDPRMGFAARTPLMIAALYGSLDVLNYLISFEQKPDINRRSETDGVTALHLAASGGAVTSVDAVRILVAAGADVDSVDGCSRRPGDAIARQSVAKCLDAILNPLKGSNSSLGVSVAAAAASKDPLEGEKKKEYPVDVSMPDIKNGIYGTDEFRMYAFKVKPCSRAYPHDWTECPFVHPGENARRRDPRKYAYSCVPCPEFRKGLCRKEDGCEYAHGVFESWLHPAQYRTRLCKDEVGCNRRVCFFAHKLEELRSVNPAAVSVNGLVASSPRSVANLDLASAAALLSPTAAPSSPGSWMSQSPAPALQLPASRLKSAMSVQDLDVDYELLGIERYQQKLIDQMQGLASPRSNFTNLYGSSQLLSGYSSSIQSSMSGLDLSMAKAIMSSRAASFAQRSQSFIDRGAVPRSPVMTTQSTGLSKWGSPDGKLDWGIQGEELNKFRKSSSFAIRSNRTISPPPREAILEEPDLSWVQSLVKDGVTNEPMVGRGVFDGKQKQYQMFSPWGEEQMVN